jgi:hypothetical protein
VRATSKGFIILLPIGSDIILFRKNLVYLSFEQDRGI